MMESLEVVLLLLSGASVALNTGVWYSLGEVKTTLRLCPTCQHNKVKK